MTRQESFKRRVRRRMEKTGERYVAARRVLIEQATRDHTRAWVAEPELSNDSVRAATGRGWDEWCDLIEQWPGHSDGHATIATYLQRDHDVDPWWAQTVTIGFERITGLRLPYQQPDGTFTAGKSQTVNADADVLRNLLLDEGQRSDLFPEFHTHLRSRPTSKIVRISIGPGIAQIDLVTRPDGRIKVTITHEQLPALEDVAEWKFYWSEWLQAIDES